MLKRPYFLLIGIALTLAVVTSACGGGTIGTGITSLSEGTRRIAPLTFHLNVTVTNSTGRPVPNAQVSLRTSTATIVRTTNSHGVASLPLSMTPSELLHFEVRSSGKLYQTDEYISPAGAALVERTLRLASSGAIEVLEE